MPSQFTLRITDSSIPPSPRITNHHPIYLLYNLSLIDDQRSPRKARKTRIEISWNHPPFETRRVRWPRYIPNFFRLNQAWREKEACNVRLTFLADTTGCFLIDTRERGWGMLATPWYLAAVVGPVVSKRRSLSLSLSPPLSLFSRHRAGMELRLTVNFVVVRGRTEISNRRDWPSARMESWRRSGEILLESWVLLGVAWPFAGTYGISDRVMMELVLVDRSRCDWRVL